MHDLGAWNALDVASQERIIDRSKLDNVEQADTETPSSAHRMLTTVTDAAGIEVKVLRDDTPVRQPGRGRVWNVVHRLRGSSGGARDHVAEHVRGPSSRQLRPAARLLHRGGRGPVHVPSAATLDELAGSPPADTYPATPVTAATDGESSAVI